MTVTKQKDGAFRIDGLTPGQLGYIAALIGAGNSNLDLDGRFVKEAIVPEAKELHLTLTQATKKHGLGGLVGAVMASQEIGREGTA
jgi:hypothetical protein